MVYPQATSLYELLHSKNNSSLKDQPSFCEIIKYESTQTRVMLKYHIAFQISQILMTIQNLTNIKCHGHLSSHNIMIEVKKIDQMNFRLRIRLADLENLDYMQYANMFYNYRIATVWSSPEVLAQPKKMPQELNPAMDVYSFGVMLWELWHCQVPFDDNPQMAAHYVVEENSRPKLIHSPQDLKELSSESDEEAKEGQEPVPKKLSNIFVKDDQSAFSSAIGGKDMDLFINVSDGNQDSGGSAGSDPEVGGKPLTFCDSTISSIIRKCWA